MVNAPSVYESDRQHSKPELTYRLTLNVAVPPLETTVRLKGLPFQSKSIGKDEAHPSPRNLPIFEAYTGEGIVVDYTITGYRACSTGVAVEARGNRQEVERRGEMKPLGQLLGVDFLVCRIGKIGLFFDPETERYFEGDNIVEPRHAITTRVVARRRAD
jgi:hypothetical protein